MKEHEKSFMTEAQLVEKLTATLAIYTEEQLAGCYGYVPPVVSEANYEQNLSTLGIVS